MSGSLGIDLLGAKLPNEGIKKEDIKKDETVKASVRSTPVVVAKPIVKEENKQPLTTATVVPKDEIAKAPVKTTTVATAFIKAYEDKIIDIPVFARMSGAEADKSKEMLKGSRTKMFDTVEEAINAAVIGVSKSG